jgi:hypothetical protein
MFHERVLAIPRSQGNFTIGGENKVGEPFSPFARDICSKGGDLLSNEGEQ